MKLIITITMDNAAFEDLNGIEAARILHKLANRVDGEKLANGDGQILVDINGNAVGTAEVTR